MMADFSTRFSFVITDAMGRGGSEQGEGHVKGDGLVFFIVPFNSSLPPKSSGGFLTLVSSNEEATLSGKVIHPFVAVEFDTFSNTWDPPKDHIGVDINHLLSVAYVKWEDNGQSRREDVLITYNSSTKNLSVFIAAAAMRGSSFVKLMSQSLPNLSVHIDLSTVLPQEVRVGFGASTGNRSIELHKILYWDFMSTSLDEKSPIMISLNWQRTLTMGLAVLVGIVVLFGVLVAKFKWWRPKLRRLRPIMIKADEISRQRTSFMELWFMELNLQHIKDATGNFDEVNMIGEGVSGKVYKCELKVGQYTRQVAVKRLFKKHNSDKDFKTEVTTLGRLAHRNLARLLGWSHHDQERILVYEFIPNKTLHHHLHGGSNQLLGWHLRYKIVHDAASALTYLHEDCGQHECLLHRDIKPGNILLDDHFNAKLADFGFARLVDHDKSLRNTALVYTPGYLAPECWPLSNFTKETDVYSFGIVLLETATGRKPYDSPDQENQLGLSAWVRKLHSEDHLLEAIDGALNGEFNRDEAKRVLQIGLWCCNPTPTCRPSMRRVLECLKIRDGDGDMEDIVIESSTNPSVALSPISL